MDLLSLQKYFFIVYKHKIGCPSELVRMELYCSTSLSLIHFAYQVRIYIETHDSLDRDWRYWRKDVKFSSRTEDSWWDRRDRRRLWDDRSKARRRRGNCPESPSPKDWRPCAPGSSIDPSRAERGEIFEKVVLWLMAWSICILLSLLSRQKNMDLRTKSFTAGPDIDQNCFRTTP